MSCLLGWETNYQWQWHEDGILILLTFCFFFIFPSLSLIPLAISFWTILALCFCCLLFCPACFLITTLSSRSHLVSLITAYWSSSTSHCFHKVSISLFTHSLNSVFTMNFNMFRWPGTAFMIFDIPFFCAGKVKDEVDKSTNSEGGWWVVSLVKLTAGQVYCMDHYDCMLVEKWGGRVQYGSTLVFQLI